MASSYPYQAKAILKFKSPPGAASLSFQKGDVLTVLEAADEEEEWLKGKTESGAEGVFPSGFVEKIVNEEEDQPEHQEQSAPPPKSMEEEEIHEPQGSKDGGVSQAEDQPATPASPVEEAKQEQSPAEILTSPPVPEPAQSATTPSNEPEQTTASSLPESSKSASEEPAETSPVPASKPAEPVLAPVTTSPPLQSKSAPSPPLASPSSKPPTKPAKPDAPTKPSSLKDRIAAFNKPAAGGPPPPVPRGKPPAFQRKPAPAPVPATSQPPAPTVPAVSTDDDGKDKDKDKDKEGGFSVADAQVAIGKGSLKDRIAALQSGKAAGPPPPPPANKPPPKPWKRPAPPPGEEGAPPPLAMGIPPPKPQKTPSLSNESPDDQAITSPRSPASGGGGDEADAEETKSQEQHHEEGAAEPGEEGPENAEAARRQAIAARMAKLGGRGMGMGMPMFGGPKPPKPTPQPKPEAADADAVAAPMGDESRPNPDDHPLEAGSTEHPSKAPEESTSTLASAPSPPPGGLKVPQTAHMPALPKRTARPKKKSAVNLKEQAAKEQAQAEVQAHDKEAPETPPVPTRESESELHSGETLTTEAGLEAEGESVEKPALGNTTEEDQTVSPGEELEHGRSSIEEGRHRPQLEKIVVPESQGAPQEAEPQQSVVSEKSPSVSSSRKVSLDMGRGASPTSPQSSKAPPPSAPARSTSISSIRSLRRGASVHDAAPSSPIASAHARKASVESVGRTSSKASVLEEPVVDERPEEERQAIQEPSPLAPHETSPPPRPSVPTPGAALTHNLSEDELEAPPALPSGRPPISPPLGSATYATSPPLPAGRPPISPPLASARSTGSPPTLHSAPPPQSPPLTSPHSNDAPDDSDARSPTSPAEAQEVEEVDPEVARKQALAQRMAKLGGRNAFAGMPIMGMRPPPAKRTPSTQEEEAKSPVEAQAVEAQHEEEEAPAPASAPPRRIPGMPKGGIALPGIMPMRPQPSAPDADSEETDHRPASARENEEDDDEAEEGEPVQTAEEKEQAPPPLPPSRPPALPPSRPPGLGPRQDSSIGSPRGSVDSERRRDSIISTHSGDVESPIAPPPLPSGRPPQPPPVPSSADITSPISGPPPPPPPGSRPSFDHPLPPPPSGTEPSKRDSLGFAPPSQPQLSLLPPGVKARELDLVLPSRWWRQSPPTVPPSISQLPDVHVDTRSSSGFDHGVERVHFQLNVVFDDWSQTVASLTFDSQATDEQNTSISQRQLAPPPIPSRDILLRWSQAIGSQIWAHARGGQTDVVDIVKSISNAIPPFGFPYPNTFGAPVLSASIATDPNGKHSHLALDEKDEVRPGDVAVAVDCRFKGKIGSSSLRVGTTDKPHVAVVAEAEAKKKKIRVFEMVQGKMDTVSWKLDEFKSGLLTVYRVPDKSWLPSS